MAGGSDWFLEDKADEFETLQIPLEDGSGDSRYFRSKRVSFTISRPESVLTIDVDEGQLGETSGILVFMAGRVLKQRVAKAGSFVCVADNLKKDQTASDYYTRVQVWTHIGRAVEYDPETGRDI